MSIYIEVYISDGVTEKRRLFDNAAAKNLSINEIVALTAFESTKPIWSYFVKFTECEAYMKTMSIREDYLSGMVSVNDQDVFVEAFESKGGLSVSLLKRRAVNQYLSGRAA